MFATPYIYIKVTKKSQCFAKDECWFILTIYLIKKKVCLKQDCIKQEWASVYIFSPPTTKHLCILDLIFFKQTQYTIFLYNSTPDDLFWFISGISKIPLLISCVLHNSAGYQHIELLSVSILNFQAAGKTKFTCFAIVLDGPNAQQSGWHWH